MVSNLKFLKIKKLIPTWDEISPLIPDSSHLTQLHIVSDQGTLMKVSNIERIISSHRSSLERITLNIGLSDQIDGNHLQTILEPCHHLKKLEFIFQYQNTEIDVTEQINHFRSDWWLNICRLPVLIICNHDLIFIASMPCVYPTSIKVSSDLNTWQLNKEQLFNSSLIRFPNVNKIHFINNNSQSITVDLIYFIDHVFHDQQLQLSFSNWKFNLPEKIVHQVCIYRKDIQEKK